MARHLSFWSARIFLLVLLSGSFPITMWGADTSIRCIDPSEDAGNSAAVVVPDAFLLHTGQILPLDNAGQAIGTGADQQIANVFGKLKNTLQMSEDEPVQIVKLNIVAANDGVAGNARMVLSAMFKGSASKPAVSYVVGKMRHPDVLIAMDAVAMRAQVKSRGRAVRFGRAPELFGGSSQAHISIMHPGSKVYISGQAEKGKDIAEMTRKTMENLGTTLEHLGLGWSAVAQVKSFVGPITAVSDAEREIGSFFKGDVPPLVFVEWTTEPSIEIELIASSQKATGRPDDTVEFITPPGMQTSPVFSRVARVAAGPTIYISGLYGDSQDNPEAETREIFGHLGKLLDKTGSDFRHLAKATYYVSTNEASAKLGTIRPEFYDPQRPPAASKAPVTGTGRAGRTITLDMIAVPVK